MLLRVSRRQCCAVGFGNSIDWFSIGGSRRPRTSI
jgi:hypothetical protein